MSHDTTDLSRLRKGALITAGLGTAALAVGFLLDPRQFFQSYLIGYLFCLALGLGSLGLTMLHNVTGGAWGFAIKRILHAGCRTLPWLGLLFIPIVLGRHELYEWTHADAVAGDPVLQHKEPYLNESFFLTRSAIYFVVWVVLSVAIRSAWRRFERDPGETTSRRLRVLSAPGIGIYALTMTFASVDWAMSLEPHWFSTIYGVHFIVGQTLATLCLATVFVAWLMRRPPYSSQISTGNLHDLGNLILAFVMLWAYVSFSQYLIIWSGNLPEETPWYLHRTGHGWQTIALLLVVFHFAVPFLVLLSRKNKTSHKTLPRLATALLALRWLDLLWLIAPAFHHEGITVSWMDFAAPLALGAWWLFLFLRAWASEPLLVLAGNQMRQNFEEVPAA